MTIRLLPVDAGCWVDGTWGTYGIALMVQKAHSLGYDDALIVNIADAKMATLGPIAMPQVSEEDEELLSEAADGVVLWLNDNVAPEGFSFGWHGGEFFLQSEAWWAE